VGYEGGNVPKEMADCAMADILSTIIRRAAFVFVVSKEATFGPKVLDERIFPRDEREKSTRL
jgi:hypothetical protein